MGEIEMVGGSGFSMSKAEELPMQPTGGGGDIAMYGGCDFHMSHTPIGSEQKGKGESGVDMVGLQGLINPKEHVSPYGQDRPIDKGHVK